MIKLTGIYPRLKGTSVHENVQRCGERLEGCFAIVTSSVLDDWVHVTLSNAYGQVFCALSGTYVQMEVALKERGYYLRDR